MSQLYGVGQNITIKQIIFDLKLYISQKNGKLTLRNLFQLFLDVDQDRKGFLSQQKFQKCLNDFGFFPKVVDMQALAIHYKMNQQDINYNQFIINLQDPMNERRENLVQKIICHYDPENKGLIDIQELKNNFQGGEKNSKQIIEFLDSFESQTMSTDDLFYFIYDLSLSILSDSQFICKIKQIRIIKQIILDLRRQKPICNLRGNKKCYKINKVEYFNKRQRLIQMNSGVHEEFLVRKIFQDIDFQKTGILQVDTLSSFLLRIDIKLQQKYLNALLKKFDPQQTGSIDFENFVNHLIMDSYA